MANVATAETSPNGNPPPAASTAMVIGTDMYRGALEPRALPDAFQIAEMVATRGLFGITSPPEALTKIMYGRNLGISAMQSLQSLHSIEGKIGIEASLMMAICLKAKHICEYFEPVLAECDDTKATFVTKRVGRQEQRLVYTIEDAEKMGVLDRGADEAKKKKNNWNANRKSMLMARCKAMLARQVYPDLTHGMYSSEELYDSAEADPNEMVAEVLSPDQAAAAAKTGPVQVVPVQAAKRDYAAEAEALKAKIAAVASRQDRAAVRAEIEKWDGVDPWRKEVMAFYNETRSKRASSETDPSAPAPMPEGNLFTNTKADPPAEPSK